MTKTELPNAIEWKNYNANSSYHPSSNDDTNDSRDDVPTTSLMQYDMDHHSEKDEVGIMKPVVESSSLIHHCLLQRNTSLNTQCSFDYYRTLLDDISIDEEFFPFGNDDEKDEEINNDLHFLCEALETEYYDSSSDY